MERVSEDDHPLSTTSSSSRPSSLTVSTVNFPQHSGNSSSSTNHNHNYYHHRSYRTPSASLIQTAVRSVLDDATPSTIVSDDQSEISFGLGAGTDAKKNPDGHLKSPDLESLKIERLPPIPGEQDRKRFIGCLAAVLASAYDYDEHDADGMFDFESASKGSFAYLEYADDEDNDNHDEKKENDGNDQQDDANTTVRTALSDSFEESSAYENDNDSTKSDFDPLKSHGVRNGQQRLKSSVSSSSGRPTLWGQGAKEKEERATQRTRRRRYDVSCALLVSSAEVLFLDKSVARGFLPMLSQILIPKKRKSGKKHSLVANESGFPPRGQTSKARSRSAPSSPVDKVPPPSISTNASFAIEQLNTAKVETGPQIEEDEEQNARKDYETEKIDEDDVLRPFLESMTPGSGFRCMSMLLLQHLLTSKVGYDSRIRYVLKRVGVLALVHDMGNDPVEDELFQSTGTGNSKNTKQMLTLATRKFESLERSIARRLIRLSNTSPDEAGNGRNLAKEDKANEDGITKDKILRGVKIGGAGLVAGTLFALTGGLAAPGIAAGVAAVAGSTVAATAAVSVLTSTAIVTTIFGVGGGGLAAYKMQRRTQGLTEFEFRKEFSDHTHRKQPGDRKDGRIEPDAQLFTTVCLSGWLRDEHDYQRPWGLHPTSPKLVNRLELLERFYSVYRSDHLPNCPRILNDWKGEEDKLWQILEEKYGRDPDHLFPFEDGPRQRGSLTLDQEEILDEMFVELGLNSVAPTKDVHQKDHRTPLERMRETWKHQRQKRFQKSKESYDSMHGPSSSKNYQYSYDQQTKKQVEKMPNSGYDILDYERPLHLETVWDYSSTYGGELYTVRWESSLLTTICNCVMELAFDVVSGATRHILRVTILSTLMAAVVLPSYLLNLANMIDGDWTLAVERADQAGQELARTLLLSRTGQRPVTLVGFSFGARVIYACLKELARLQEEWEDYQEMKKSDYDWSLPERHIFAKLQKKFDGMREPSSIVEDAVIMGLPNHLSLHSWKACRRVVGGRLVNCYSTKDLILSLMFQAKRFSPGIQTILKPVCGTCEVNEHGVENIDVSDLVLGHQDYCLQTGKILERVKFGEPLRQKRSYDESIKSAVDASGPARKLQFTSS